MMERTLLRYALSWGASRSANGTLLIATDEVARAGADAVPMEGPDRFAFYDHVALVELGCLLSGQADQDGMMDAFERVCGDNEGDGPWVDRLPQELVDRLAALTPEQIPPLARAWASTETLQAMHRPPRPDPVISFFRRLLHREGPSPAQRRHEEEKLRQVEESLTLLVRLVQRAKQSGKGVYLWVSV